jgi:hypothetical protein
MVPQTVSVHPWVTTVLHTEAEGVCACTREVTRKRHDPSRYVSVLFIVILLEVEAFVLSSPLIPASHPP